MFGVSENEINAIQKAFYDEKSKGSWMTVSKDTETLSKMLNTDSEALTEWISNLDKSEIQSMSAGEAIQKYTEYIKENSQSLTAGEKASTLFKNGLKGVKSAITSIGISMVASFAISGVMKLVSTLANLNQNAIDKAKELTEELDEQKKKIESNLKTVQGYKERFEQLSKGVSDYGSNISLTTSEYDEYNKIVGEIVGISPSLIEGWNAEGKAIINKNDAIQQTIDKLKEQEKLQGKTETSATNVETIGEAKIAEYKKLLPYQSNNEPFENYFEDIKKARNVYKEKILDPLNKLTANDDGYIDYYNFKSEMSDLLLSESLPTVGTSNQKIELIKNYFKQFEENQEKIEEVFKKYNFYDKYEQLEQSYTDYLDSQKAYDSQLEQASKSFNPTLLNVAKYTDNYENLTDAQKTFVSQYINGFSIDKNSDVDKMRSDVVKFVNTVFSPPDSDSWSDEQKAKYKSYFDDILSLDKNLSVSEYQAKFDELFDKFKDMLPEDTVDKLKDDILNSLGIGKDVKGNSVVDEVVGKLTGKAEENGKLNGVQWKDILNINELKLASEHIDDINWDIVNSIEDFRNQLNEFANDGKVSKFVTNLFALKDQGGTETDIGKLTSQLDKIQSAYQTLYNAINQYNEEGFISVDTYQSILEAGSQYLKFLFDENGDLKLNKEALKELALARIEEQEAKAKQALIDNLDNIKNEADAQEYLKDSLELSTEATESLTEATIKNKYAQLLNSNVTKEEADKIISSVISQFNNITRLSKAAKDGLNKSTDMAMGTISSAKDLKKQIKDLNDKQSLNDLQYAIDKTTEKVNALDRSIEILDAALDLTSENDYTTRFDYMSQKMDIAQQKASALKKEFENLITVQPKTASEAEALASRMEQVGSSLRENYKSAVESRVEIEKLKLQSFTSVGSAQIEALHSKVSEFTEGLDRLENGGLYTFETSFMPTIPQSAYEKQKAENDKLIEDQQRTSDAITKIKLQAIELQKKENDKAVADERAKLAAATDATVENVNKANDTISKDIVDTSSEIGGTINETTQNVVSSIDSAVDHVKEKLGELKTPVINFASSAKDLFDNLLSQTPTVHGSNAKLNNALSKWMGVPYVYGGTSKSGADCSGLFRGVLSDFGIEAEKKGIPRTAADLYGSSQHISEKDLQPGDLVFYAKDGNVNHVGIYVGNGKMVHAPHTGDVVKEVDYNYKKPFGYGRYSVFSDLLSGYASGTTQGNIKSKKLGIAGENNKPEILIDKDSGRHEYIDSPTLIDTSKTDVVGEKQTSRIKKYASGTPMTNADWLKYLKEACDALGIPYNIALSLIDQETSGGRAADTWKVNSAGAYGLTQITPSALGDLTDGSAVANKYLALLTNNGVDINKSRTGGAANARDNIWVGLATLSAIRDRYFKGDDPDLKKSLGWYYAGGHWNGKDGQWYADSVINRAQTQPFVDAANALGDKLYSASEKYENVLSETEQRQKAMMDYIKANSTTSEEEINNRYDKLESDLSADMKNIGDFYAKLLDDKSDDGKANVSSYRGRAQDDIEKYTIKQGSLETRRALELFELASAEVDSAEEYIKLLRDQGADAQTLEAEYELLKNKKEKKKQTNDDYISATDAIISYFSGQIGRSANDFNNRVENVNVRRGYVSDEMDVAKTSAEMHELYHADASLISDAIKEAEYQKQNLLDMWYGALAEIAGEDSPLKEALDQVSLEYFFDERGNVLEEKLNEFLAPYRASSDPYQQAIATNVYKLVNDLGKDVYSAYVDAYDKQHEAEKEQTEVIRKELDSGFQGVEEWYSKVEKDIQKRNEELEKQNTKLNGLLNISSGYYEATNKLSEVQHNANNAIADSRILKQYLNSDEYKRIYNEEDYQKITDKVKTTQKEIDALTSKFKRDVEQAYSDDNLYLVETITSEYERQLDLKQREVEITQSELDLRKKEQQLQNVLTNRNIRQMVERNGKFEWEWVADTDKVRQATEDLENARYEIEKQQTEREQTLFLNKYRAEMDDISNLKSANEQWIKELGESIDNIKEKIDDFNNPISDLKDSLSMFQEYGISGLNSAVNDMLKIFGDFTGENYNYNKLFNGNIVSANANGNAPENLSVGTLVNTADGDYLITGVNDDGSYSSVKAKGRLGTSLRAEYDNGKNKRDNLESAQTPHILDNTREKKSNNDSYKYATGVNSDGSTFSIKTKGEIDTVKSGHGSYLAKNTEKNASVDTADSYNLAVGTNSDGSHFSIKTKGEIDTLKSGRGSYLADKNGSWFTPIEPQSLNEIYKNYIAPLSDAQMAKFGLGPYSKSYYEGIFNDVSNIEDWFKFRPTSFTKNSSSAESNNYTLNGDMYIQNPKDFNAFIGEMLNRFRKN